ncbi:MAG: hypothetical protein DRQ55_08275 [Planctomycetota bacterium]|nr:MAG: hypothetical protein DRQ55_08275 [Planctomycetota bacterium]
MNLWKVVWTLIALTLPIAAAAGSVGCPRDVNDDGVIDFDDALEVYNVSNLCENYTNDECASLFSVYPEFLGIYDVNDDGVVNISDAYDVYFNQGPCTPSLNHSYVGTLCGPANVPCVVGDDDLLDGPAFRGKAPSITIDALADPHVLFGSTFQGFFGYYAHQHGQTWFQEGLPSPVAQGTVAVDLETEVPIIAADDGAFGVTSWTRSGGAWTLLDTFAPGRGRPTLVRDFDGTLHLAYGASASGGSIGYGVNDGSGWQAQNLAGLGTYVRLAVSDWGTAHLTEWDHRPQSGWELQWRIPGQAIETAFALNSNILSTIRRHEIVTSGGSPDAPDGTPHLLFEHGDNDEFKELGSIKYATRTAAGTWSLIGIAQDVGYGCPPLWGPGGGSPGQVCNYDFVRHSPVAIITTHAGEVRFFYTRTHRLGVKTAMGVPGDVYWEETSDQTTSDLYIGWIDANGAPQSAVAVPGSFAQRGAAAVDFLGRVHLVLYETVAGQGQEVRYLRLDP